MKYMTNSIRQTLAALRAEGINISENVLRNWVKSGVHQFRHRLFGQGFVSGAAGQRTSICEKRFGAPPPHPNHPRSGGEGTDCTI